MSEALSKCGFCRGPLHEANAPRCTQCQTRHHLECWQFNNGCTQFACANSPDAVAAAPRF